MLLLNPRLKPRAGARLNPTHWAGQAAGCWLMNEGAGATMRDLSRNANTATLNGSAAWSTDDRGFALRFSGDATGTQYAAAPNTPALNPTDVSLAVWFKTSATFQTATANMLAAKAHNFFNNVFQWALFAAQNNRVIFRCYATSNAIIGTVVTTTTYADNKWHHALGTYSNASNMMQLYVDGQSIGSVSNLTSKMAADGTAPLVIGGFGATITGCASFTGLIGEVRVYPFAASAAQAWQLYQRPYAMLMRRSPRHGFFPGLDHRATFAEAALTPRFNATIQATSRYSAAANSTPRETGGIASNY